MEPPHRLSTFYQLGVQSLRKIKISINAPIVWCCTQSAEGAGWMVFLAKYLVPAASN